MSKEDFLSAEKSFAKKEEEIEFCFRPKNKSVVFDFMKWECDDRHTRIQIVEENKN